MIVILSEAKDLMVLQERRFFAALRMTWGHGGGDGGKILRCAQNDMGVMAGEMAERFFAALRMTCSQNDM